MELVSMKMNAEEQAEYAGPTALADKPEYSYGTQISIDDDKIDALGFHALPQVGETMMIQARVTVIGVSQNQYEGGDNERCVRLQITDMAIGPDTTPSNPSKVLYGG